MVKEKGGGFVGKESVVCMRSQSEGTRSKGWWTGEEEKQTHVAWLERETPDPQRLCTRGKPLETTHGRRGRFPVHRQASEGRPTPFIGKATVLLSCAKISVVKTQVMVILKRRIPVVMSFCPSYICLRYNPTMCLLCLLRFVYNSLTMLN